MDVSTQQAGDRKARKKNRMIRIIGTVVALVVVAFTPVLFPRLEFADSYLKIVLALVVAAAILAGTWGILIHGNLRQRSDYWVALATALLMLALAVAANWLYSEDWVWARTCASVGYAYPNECGDITETFRYSHNAANLDQIHAVLAIGQLIPLLSIFKDVVYCWRRPTPWFELQHDGPDARSVRHANLRLSRIPKDS